MKGKKILLCGGGTGGHVLPLVEVARGIKKLAPETKIYFAGPEEFSLDSLKEEGVIVKKIIAAGKIRRYFSWLNLLEPFKIPWAMIQSFFVVLAVDPDVVLGKGSYGSIWPILAAWALRKKIILHESDAAPGLANRFLARFVGYIALSFEETARFFSNHAVYKTGNPVRLKYIGLTKDEAGQILNIETTRSIVFISGGSQGARKINRVILDSLGNLLKEYFIIWSTGKANYAAVKPSGSDSGKLKVVPFLNEKELAAAYILCDLAVGRAGAGTIFELAAFGRPSILIPLERKNGDQPLNAAAYAETGSSVVLSESRLTSEKLISEIKNLLSYREKLFQMSQNAQKFAKIDAGEKLAQILLDL